MDYVEPLATPIQRGILWDSSSEIIRPDTKQRTILDDARSKLDQYNACFGRTRILSNQPGRDSIAEEQKQHQRAACDDQQCAQRKLPMSPCPEIQECHGQGKA